MAPVPDDPTKKKSEIDRLSGPPISMTVSSSDSDEGEVAENEYQLLPQSPDLAEPYNNGTVETQQNNGSSQVLNEQEQNTSAIETIESKVKDNSVEEETDLADTAQSIDVEKKERCELWNNTPTKNDITIDQEKANTIREAMSGFKLPTASIPPWASNITENNWLKKLSEIGGNKHSNNDDDKS
ncbi:unnamed protein product [Owenia fusiformis]|uniref:Male-enhanced antigen 1 n=1 Tax=Owenia fusiformis TaxID=6347 RepID=A0A8S4PHA8_OWEFU|nr:unnamed protein product [Owenia fusiformis]